MPALPVVSDDDRRELLSGRQAFGEIVPAAPTIDALETNTAMQDFLAPILEHRSSNDRLRHLIEELDDRGFLNFRYEEALTQTAADTFGSGAGNCLSYTNLFVALTRELGLRARYQRVDVPPTWDIQNDLLIRSNHINVVIPHVRTSTGDAFVMDFNYVEPEMDFPRWGVSDEHAFALMYANLSVEALKEGDLRQAFSLQKRAILVDPENADHWVNLGVIYTQAGDPELAEAAFTIALRRAWQRTPALAGLASLYRQTGRIEAAEKIEVVVRRARKRNPFFHLAIGEAAYQSDRYANALASFDRAIALRPRTGAFHFMRGLTLYQLGDISKAERGMRLAMQYGQVDDLVRRYYTDLVAFVDTVTPTTDRGRAPLRAGWRL